MTSGLKERLKPPLQKLGLLRWYYDLYPQRPLYIESLWAYIKLSRWVITFRMRVRMLWYLLKSGGRVQQLDLAASRDEGAVRHLPRVVDHNLLTDFSVRFSRRRSEHLIYLLRSIPTLKQDAPMLVIGPKNEGEILLLRAHGFSNVQAIDLFSYSPLIRLMDMHRMDFPADSFSVLYCGWVVRYSYDVRRWAKEVVRVCRHGAHVAIALSLDPAEKQRESPGMGTPLYGGLDELLGYFEGHVDHVYWRLEDKNEDERDLPRHTHSLVFRLKK